MFEPLNLALVALALGMSVTLAKAALWAKRRTFGKKPILNVFDGCERIVERAVAVLPLAEQDRYLEEYRSELYDLTADGASRCVRVVWSLRVLVRAPRLRRELRKPQRERAR